MASISAAPERSEPIIGLPGGAPIPISTVRLGADVEEAVLAVLRSGSIAQGPVVAELERAFAEMIGVRHVVAVNNGTTALVAALQVLDLEPGDEVVTSPFTFVATLNAALEAGATVRFADIDEVTYNVDPGALEAQVSDRTRVLMPVHLYGQCADMASIAELADRHDLDIVEDAAQAHGARIGARGAGSWGLGCFSLYATKNLTAGEGGLISTDDDELADRLRLLRNQGMRQRYQYEMAGHNYRLTDLQAAVCLPQLAGYGDQVAARHRNAAVLSAGLADVAGLVTPVALPGNRHVWHQYTVRLTADAPLCRDELVARLGEAGIGCGTYYPRPVFDYDCYRGHPQVIAGDVPVARAAAASCVSLPVHQHLSLADLDRVIDTVRALMGAA